MKCSLCKIESDHLVEIKRFYVTGKDWVLDVCVWCNQSLKRVREIQEIDEEAARFKK